MSLSNSQSDKEERTIKRHIRISLLLQYYFVYGFVYRCKKDLFEILRKSKSDTCLQ